jgi:8-hydroxy-5-deazaflavin:NADPH oxidoreductase
MTTSSGNFFTTKTITSMTIAIIGTGNVGGALASKWAQKGHHILLGVRDITHFKGAELLSNPNTVVMPIRDAVQKAEVILLATPAPMADEVAKSLGDTNGKIIIDAMNVVMGRGPQGFNNTSDAILANTASRDVVKCFNTTGYNNMLNPEYNGVAIDAFMAGDSVRGKNAVRELALDAGFAECYDVGGNDRFQLMEQFAFFWINLAMLQGQGREIGFKLLKR